MREAAFVVRIVQLWIVQACGLFQFDGNFVLGISRSLLQIASFVVCSGPLFLMTILNVYSEYIVIFLFLFVTEPFGGSIGRYIDREVYKMR